MLSGENLHLLLSVDVILCHFDHEGIFIGVIVQVDEAIVEKESRIALFAVGVIDLIATFDVFKRLNDETLPVISV